MARYTVIRSVKKSAVTRKTVLKTLTSEADVLKYLKRVHRCSPSDCKDGELEILVTENYKTLYTASVRTWIHELCKRD